MTITGVNDPPIIKISTPQAIDTTNPNIDLTLKSGQIVENMLGDFGFSSSSNLESSWNTVTNTLNLSFDSSTNNSFSLIEHMPTISLDDIGDIFKTSMLEDGFSNINGYSFSYDVDNNQMDLSFDSAYLSGIYLTNYILHVSFNANTKTLEVSGSLFNSDAGSINISNADLSATEVGAFTVLMLLLDTIATVDLTDIDFAQFSLELLGYSDIVGLSSNWDGLNKTYAIEVDSAKYEDRIINDAKIVSASNSNGDITAYSSQAIVYGADPTLSQAEISEVVMFALGELGYSSISGFTSNWTTSNDVLTVSMDSAYLSSLRITNISMNLGLDTNGNVSSYSGSTYIPSYGQWVSLTKSDLTTTELAIIKQTYLAIDALETISDQSTSSDVAMIALKVLGYEQISGLTSSWNRELLTSTIEVNSARLDGNLITNATIVASTNSSGNINDYSSTGSITNQYGYTYDVSYNQYNLNDAEKFVIQAGNYAMAEINGALQTFNKYDLSDTELFLVELSHEVLVEIDRVTANHNFTNGDIAIVFDDAGNIISYDSSIEHSDVGTIVGTAANLDVSEVGIVKDTYTEINTLEGMVKNIQSAANMNDVVKLTLEYSGWSDLSNIVVTWDDNTTTANITFDGLYNGETRTDPRFTMTAGADGELTAFSYTANSPSGSKQMDLIQLNDIQLYSNKVALKVMSDLYALEQAANHTSKLTNNISFDLYKDNIDTDQNLIIDNGELRINENYDFDVIKLTDISTYTQNINISDAIDVLRHIVNLETLTGSAFHAADTDNNGSVNISDAIDILRHIVNLETIDTFDLIDDSGNRISELDANASGDAPTWTLVANGNVDMSGSGFDGDYVVAMDIV